MHEYFYESYWNPSISKPNAMHENENKIALATKTVTIVDNK